MQSTGTYFIYDRLIDLESQKSFHLEDYIKKWEISRSTAMRDIQHLRHFKKLNINYDRASKKWEVCK